MKRHPARNELIVYAESLVARRPISAKTGAHVKDCPVCMAEVNAMRESLGFVFSAPALEPSSNLTQQILLAARKERQVLQQSRRRHPVLKMLVRATLQTAALAVIGAMCYFAALGSVPASCERAAVPATAAALPALSQDTLLKAAAEIQILLSAVNIHSSKTPPSFQELEHRRTVRALTADIEAARAALERNPGCDRATQIIDLNLQRQARTLKALYAERSL